jgi:hypothetical protein
MVSKATFEKAMKAALDGPEVKKIKFGKHEFNVKKSTVTGSRVDGVQVSGRISHHRSFMDDDQVDYKARIQAGQAVTIDQIEFSIDRSFMNKFLGDLVKVLVKFFAEKVEKGLSTQALATRPAEAEARIYEESKKLIDGSWEGEAKMLMVNIVGRQAIRQAQVVYRRTKPGGVKVPPKTMPLPTPAPKPAPRDHRTKGTHTP